MLSFISVSTYRNGKTIILPGALSQFNTDDDAEAVCKAPMNLHFFGPKPPEQFLEQQQV